MQKARHWLKVFIFDLLGVLCIIAAGLTGWLPGPGGIPLFLIGLGLLAVHHEWARRYIDRFRDYVDRATDLVFVDNPRIQLGFDILAPLLAATGAALLVHHGAVWMVSLGIVLVFLALSVFLGNRNRYKQLKQKLKR